jgi:hypothetical protein
VRAARSLEREANLALHARQPVLSAYGTDFASVLESSRRKDREETMDQLAKRYAAEYKRFLEMNNLDVLSQQLR